MIGATHWILCVPAMLLCHFLRPLFMGFFSDVSFLDFRVGFFFPFFLFL